MPFLTFGKNIVDRLGNNPNKTTIMQDISASRDVPIDGSLFYKGKPLYRVIDKENTDPKNIEEVNSRVLIAIPTARWQRICENNKFDKEEIKNSRLLKDYAEMIDASTANFSLVSPPYNNNRERFDSFNLLMEAINDDFTKVLNLINKNKAADNAER